MQSSVNRVALVTGANRGIGFEISRQLALKKITVLMGSRDPERGRASCSSLSKQGLDTHSVLLDVTDPATIQAALGRIQDEFERLDILVNNAGISIDSHTSILELSVTVFQNTLETNAFGPLLLSQACIPMMRANRYGRIVNMSSTLGSLSEIARPDSKGAQVLAPAYRLSKTLLNGMTVLLAKELMGTNILVNSACPGWVRTDMGGDRAALSPEEGAATPVWLATLPDDGPTGGFFRQKQPVPW
ncbi:MAG: SDR family oxidoreductase [Desulfobacteraceae bacterium]|nr:MAG: SDR family oxidoreductase [Desulfobacteraceae bacterium]